MVGVEDPEVADWVVNAHSEALAAREVLVRRGRADWRGTEIVSREAAGRLSERGADETAEGLVQDIWVQYDKRAFLSSYCNPESTHNAFD